MHNNTSRVFFFVCLLFVDAPMPTLELIVCLVLLRAVSADGSEG